MRIIPGKKMRINHAQPKAAKAHQERRSNVPATRVPEGSHCALRTACCFD
jgi:hypothetical protein